MGEKVKLERILFQLQAMSHVSGKLSTLVMLSGMSGFIF